MDQYDLTYENIQEIGEQYKGSIVTSFYDNEKWIEHEYEIKGSNFTGYNELTLQNLDINSKVHLYKGNKIKIRKSLVKGITSDNIVLRGCGGGGGGGGRCAYSAAPQQRGGTLLLPVHLYTGRRITAAFGVAVLLLLVQ